MDLRTSSLPSDVLVQFYTAVRITVAVVFFTITRKPPSFLVQAGPPLAALTTAFSPCFIVLLVPYYLRLATRRTLCDAPRYVDESVCTDVEEEDERTAVELSDVDISSDDTVIHDINWGEDDSNVKKCESRDVVFLNEIPGEAGRDGEDVVKEGPSEGNEEALLDRRDMMPSDEIIHDISPDEEDAGNSERLEEADIEFSDEITRAIDLDEMVVGGDAKLEENDMVSCGQAPDITDQSTEEDITNKNVRIVSRCARIEDAASMVIPMREQRGFEGQPVLHLDPSKFRERNLRSTSLGNAAVASI
ncbi:hypothetical protein APSETT444_005598 [Aspergillus pseudonomiae]